AVAGEQLPDPLTSVKLQSVLPPPFVLRMLTVPVGVTPLYPPGLATVAEKVIGAPYALDPTPPSVTVGVASLMSMPLLPDRVCWALSQSSLLEMYWKVTV